MTTHVAPEKIKAGKKITIQDSSGRLVDNSEVIFKCKSDGSTATSPLLKTHSPYKTAKATVPQLPNLNDGYVISVDAPGHGVFVVAETVGGNGGVVEIEPMTGAVGSVVTITELSGGLAVDDRAWFHPEGTDPLQGSCGTNTNLVGGSMTCIVPDGLVVGETYMVGIIAEGETALRYDEVIFTVIS